MCIVIRCSPKGRERRNGKTKTFYCVCATRVSTKLRRLVRVSGVATRLKVLTEPGADEGDHVPYRTRAYRAQENTLEGSIRVHESG